MSYENDAPVWKLRVRDERYTVWDSTITLPGGEAVLSLTYLNPNQSTRGHSHPHAETYELLSGEGFLFLGDAMQPMKSSFPYQIPPDTFHQVINTGNGITIILCRWASPPQ
jgi:oxalate decarboxylase/phosphoglucose isomerase-like protein (cupin superfamily)